LTLPTFLGIGVAKAGTTWLTELLSTHPEVYLPTKVKDIRYFDHFYDKGIAWYEKFFPSDAKAVNYRAIGEFTAHYLFCDECPQRMAKDLDRPKLLPMLRNPAERTWSNYKHTARLRNYQHSFDRYLEDHREGIGHSLYSKHIKRYQEYFGPDQLLILLYDRVFNDVSGTRKKVAQHLGIDPTAFPEDAGMLVVNKGYIPRYRTIYSLVARSAWFARNHQLHWPVYIGKKMGIKQMISVKGEQPERMSDESREM